MMCVAIECSNNTFTKIGGGVFLGHSLIIIKWTWGVFPQILQSDPPFHTIRHKRVVFITYQKM